MKYGVNNYDFNTHVYRWYDGMLLPCSKSPSAISANATHTHTHQPMAGDGQN